MTLNKVISTKYGKNVNYVGNHISKVKLKKEWIRVNRENLEALWTL